MQLNSWLSMSCRNLKSPASVLFKKWNKDIPCFFDFSLALISHLIFLINKHEAALLPHSYMQLSFFYCYIFLTSRLWINIHNRQYPSELQKHLFTHCESGWFSSQCLAMKHTALNVSYWTWFYFHICRLVLFMFRHMSPAVKIPHPIPLCLLIFKKDVHDE